MKSFIVVLCCLFAITYGQTDLPAIRRNARFQRNLALVALHNQIFGAEGVENGLAKTQEEKVCILNVKEAALEEGNIVLDETVGKIIPEVERLSTSGTEAEIKAFLDKTDYPAYKKSAMNEFKQKIMTWIPAVQGKMAACRK
uniref:Venom protein family 1 protein 1 n=1 Tax=Platymeris rhadamanthus TaxID=1134088 RepID=F1P1_PLARH|nr:RecName: Full=Venom protein family 1 protein 1; Short=f1p1; Flags: Precursor [Platymeris rhadamanthus]QHB21468.1 venom protein family 1 protein 1 [Platymeris rhadamanthus]